MNKISRTTKWGKWLIIVASFFLCIGMGTTQALAVNVVDTTGNNFTMLDKAGDVAPFGGTNDVHFTWDGTLKTSVAASGQVSNATISSSCPFFGGTWVAHDVAIYGPGSYTVYTGCAPGSPGCGTGTSYTFTVNPGEIGGHMLFDWNGNNNIDVVDVWQPGLAFGPTAQMWTGACLTGDAAQVWDWMSYDWYFQQGYSSIDVNGAPMLDGPFSGSFANFNLMGTLCGNVVCDDNNPCTDDTCDPATGCVYTDNAASCNDGLFCNGTDTCVNKICVHSGDPCIAPLVCNETTDHCDDLCADAATRCNDHNVCTNDSCNSATGECMHSNNTAACDDGNACTIGDVCSGGVCQPGAPKDCSDGKACTNDICTAGVCSNPVNCTGGQVCNAQGVCETPACNCPDDGNPCTDDVCVNNVCTHPNNTAACDDGNACTIGDVCSGGVCQPGAPKNCSDGKACTNDICTAGVCSNPVNCTGGQVCNAQGVCETPACNCPDDGNPCTDDVCVNNVCTHPNNTAACDDGNACTVGDVCSGGVCQPGAAKDCSDGNDCTADSCNPATGCVYTNICPTGSDVGITGFRVPSDIKACRNAVPIQIMARNSGTTKETGSITLYKDGGAVKTWTDVVFNARQNVSKIYLYNPREEGGETIQWKAVVNVPDDPDLSNNTSTVMTMSVAECKDIKDKHNNGH